MDLHRARTRDRPELLLALRASQSLDRIDDVAVRADLVDQRFRQHDAELAFDLHRELDDVELVSCEVDEQRDVGGQILEANAQIIGHDTSNAWPHELRHNPTSPRTR